MQVILFFVKKNNFRKLDGSFDQPEYNAFFQIVKSIDLYGYLYLIGAGKIPLQRSFPKVNSCFVCVTNVLHTDASIGSIEWRTPTTSMSDAGLPNKMPQLMTACLESVVVLTNKRIHFIFANANSRRWSIWLCLGDKSIQSIVYATQLDTMQMAVQSLCHILPYRVPSHSMGYDASFNKCRIEA